MCFLLIAFNYAQGARNLQQLMTFDNQNYTEASHYW